MNKLPPKHLVFQCGVFVAPVTIFLSTVTLITRYASCQLKPNEQQHYQIKKILFVHTYRLFPFELKLIIGIQGFKPPGRAGQISGEVGSRPKGKGEGEFFQ
jgi:hypothetical protein